MRKSVSIYTWNDLQDTLNGSFTSNHFGIEIESISFGLPVAELEREFSHSTAKERNVTDL